MEQLFHAPLVGEQLFHSPIVGSDKGCLFPPTNLVCRENVDEEMSFTVGHYMGDLSLRS